MKVIIRETKGGVPMFYTEADELGTYSTRFELVDEAGNVIATKQNAPHLQRFLIERGIKPGETYLVRSTATKHELKVTAETTMEEWRKFNNDCLMALD